MKRPWTFLLGSLAVAAAVGATAGSAAAAEERSLVLASTTSTDNSGLFAHLLPIFEAETGIKVHVVAVGTGQAIKMARDGDADVLFVHDTPSEQAFVADGFGVERLDVMYNDFVIVGPAADPAGIAGMGDAPAALRRIAESGAPFASRGDNSGTHKAERRLWTAAGIDPEGASGEWYRETGAGMGATLNTASGMDAYTMSDRATWTAFRNPGGLKLLVAGDERLFNQYGVMRVDEARHPHVKVEESQAFVEWIVSEDGQAAIAAFNVAGQQLFFPNAKKTD